MNANGSCLSASGGRGGKSGFTLIELLVVVAIIALLVAILLPALQRARDTTKAAVCGVQTRNLAMGFLMYNEAWGHLPWPYSPVYPIGYGGSIYTLHPSVALELEQSFGLDSSKAYTCPATEDPDVAHWMTPTGPAEAKTDATYFLMRDYSIYCYLDTNVGSYGQSLAADAKVATHEPENLTAEHAVTGCTAHRGFFSSPWNTHWHYTSYEGINTGYADGHVEWTPTPDDFYDDGSTCQFINEMLYVWWK